MNADTTTRPFQLDEAALPDWLAEVTTENDPAFVSSLDPGWSPDTCAYADAHIVPLLDAAQDAGILTGPGKVLFEADADGYYRWLLQLAPGSLHDTDGYMLTLASDAMEVRHAGEGYQDDGGRINTPPLTGQARMVTILREAADTANQLTAALRAHESEPS